MTLSKNNDKMTQDDLTREERAAAALWGLFRRYGYTPYTMSKFEEYDLYVRNKSFLISDQIITFTDRTGRLLALKPDVTLSIVKNSRDTKEGRSRVYYRENVYRVAPGESAFREIMQTGLETIGAIDTYAVCEVVSLAKQSLSLLGGADYVLELSHLDIVSGLLDRLELDEASRAEVLRCLGEKNTHDLARLCADIGVDRAGETALCRLITACGAPAAVLPVLEAMAAEGQIPADAVAELATVARAAGEDKLRIDFSLINDMNYYNGIVFRGFVKGIPGGVLSGGEYDGLMRKMGRSADAIGFAVYLDLLERLPDGGSRPEYDLDILLLYKENSDPAALSAKMRELTDAGHTVAAFPEGTPAPRARRTLKMDEKGGALDA